MAYDSELLNLAYARTGIGTASLAYDLELTNFINSFFQEAGRRGVRLNLYGGTPLNRGFFAERQRLSLDLDIAIPKGGRFNFDIINLRDTIKEMGYREVRSKLLEESFVAHVSKGEATIKVELHRAEFAAKTQFIVLHPMLEYYGLPLLTTKVPSYEFEYLLASKLHALARRMIYRDVYDSFTGLQIVKDTGKLMRYVRSLDRERKTDAVGEITKRVAGEDYGYRQAEDTVYEQLVPLRYREDRGVMAEFIVAKLNEIAKLQK
ncbi:MAG: nucleotidyl transferase AbiEii/AbiGii toxin family protein [Candidatus Micrarchaeota archaeon]|nr:nucleotidyl transferase AbiEii/AbiGii toxin family protein [Candidatus Micrarchaeota archaeon]